MQVFKVYFKIIKANMGQMFIYLIVFLSISLLYSLSSTTKTEESFSQTKADVAFINLDEDTSLLTGFKKYLSKNANFIDIENKPEKLQDALFFRDVDYIVTVPKGFTKDFLLGEPIELQKTVVPNSTTRMYVDMAINKYFNTARVYVNNTPAITVENLVKEVSKGASLETSVQLKSFGVKKQNNGFAVASFNYLAYALFSVLILGVSSISMVFNNKNLNRRNLCSPLKNRSYNLQLIMGNLVFALATYGVMAGFGFILNRDHMMSYNGLLLCINALVFTVAALSISYLVGLLIKNRNAQSAIANVLALGFSFISGVFVPQEFLSDKAIAIASFTPTYWYVKANNIIGTLSNFSFDNLLPIFTYMLIELGFAIAIFSVALVVSKQNRITNS
ncbi:ABC transporter permease [Clostridium bowmanii]|uniref:ABC transporter permease n=1 Tax=Clostridium bowmanii TaxID=132925 RepID=UPI001C0AA807|nr:ABC transporter permease [Clostridium bowmanii]MBU3191815.1 ABC transporter permease [Clostridium bowmanii]MCA1076091.1 ABC transporter permease [Clostridium bowmanii]